MLTKVPILNDEYKVCVMWDCTPEQVKRHWEKHFEEKSSLDHFENIKEKNRASCFMAEGYHPFIVIWDKKNFYSELAHEAFHAMEHICEHIGEPVRGEFVAHSIGAIVRAVAEKK